MSPANKRKDTGQKYNKIIQKNINDTKLNSNKCDTKLKQEKI